MNSGTLLRLMNRGTVRTLPGVHAKTYIIDNVVLITSANLTETFTKRREIGALLDAAESVDAIDVFESWWNSLAAEISEHAIAEWERCASPSAPELEVSP